MTSSFFFGGSSSDDDDNPSFLVLFLVSMVVYFVSFLLIQALSRYRQGVFGGKEQDFSCFPDVNLSLLVAVTEIRDNGADE